jgi:hypothetical protein
VEGILMRDSENDTLVHLGKLNGKINFFNLSGNVFDINELSIDSVTLKLYALNDSTFNYSFLSSGGEDEEEEVEEESAPTKYDIQVGKLKITNANFIYSTKPGAKHPGVVDFQDLRLRNINLHAHNIIANDKNMMTFARIDSLRANDECGFWLGLLKVKADFSDKGLALEDLSLICPETNLDAEHIIFSYNNLDAFSNFVDSVAMDVAIKSE